MSQSTPRVLIVEDDFIVGQDLREMVRSLGLETIGPISGVAPALAVVRDVQVDAALLDVRIDGGLSFEVADALDTTDIPYAFVTGLHHFVDREERFATKRIVGKPMRLSDIAKALRECGMPVEPPEPYADR